jgi:serine/threonine-protein kinase RsbW
MTEFGPNNATMEVRNGPLLGPVLSRVIGMLAARAQCPIDRLDDALLVADTIAAHSPDYALDGGVRVDLAASEGVIELTVGDLRSQGAADLLRDAELPGVGNVLERVADTVEVREGGEDAGGDALYIRLGFGA